LIAKRNKARLILVAKFTNDPGDHNSIGFCFATQAMGELHGRAEKIIMIRYRLPGVNAYPHSQTFGRISVV